MKTRILVAIPIALVLIAALILQSWVFVGLILLLSLIGEYEILKALEAKGSPAIWSIPFLFTIAIPIVLFYSSLGILFILFVIFVLLLFIIAMFRKKYSFESVMKSVFAMVYPQMLFLFAYLITYQFTNMKFFETNPIVLIMAIIPPIFCDIAAYFFGKAFGKRKLCPDISPHKTVAGAIAGVAGGLVAGLLIYIFMASGTVIHLLYWNMDIVHFLILGAVVAAISQMGDLSASYIKRYFDIKDYGKILPGHGGILDRVDSILFALPIVYLYFIVYNSFAAALL